jgi:hypothetical protein
MHTTTITSKRKRCHTNDDTHAQDGKIRRGKNVGKDAKAVLTKWLFSKEHFDFPYPTLQVGGCACKPTHLCNCKPVQLLHLHTCTPLPPPPPPPLSLSSF